MKKEHLDADLVRQLAALLDETGLSEIEIAEGDAKIRVAKNITMASSIITHSSSPTPHNMASTPAANSAPDADALLSPMVGNAYLSPRPDAEPFVKVGQKVSVGDTVLIIEAMKVMNPIPATKSGTVKEILVSNGQPVEYNEPLVIIA